MRALSWAAQERGLPRELVPFESARTSRIQSRTMYFVPLFWHVWCSRSRWPLQPQPQGSAELSKDEDVLVWGQGDGGN